MASDVHPEDGKPRVGHYTQAGRLIREVEILPDWTFAEQLTVEAGEILLVAFPQELHATFAEITPLTRRAHGSRWAAFTDGELRAIRACIGSALHHQEIRAGRVMPIYEELGDELERRRG